MRLLLSLALAAVLAAPAATALAKPAPCSGATVSGKLPGQQGLPKPVEAMRQAIARAAAACDYAALEKLGKAGGPMFNFTFGPPGKGPGAFWREAEKAGTPVLANLVKILAMPHAMNTDDPDDEAFYAWPSAFSDEPKEADWKALRPLYASEAEWKAAVARQRDHDGYTGPRLGITVSGDWIFYIAGGD